MKRTYRTFARINEDGGVELDFLIGASGGREQQEWRCVEEYSNYSEEEWEEAITSEGEYRTEESLSAWIQAGEYFPVEIEVEDE